ncbi:MAG: (2Fe-2S)-binding protein [Actinobacteria bacterium]|nr:(2Fe-2S)-binding protein [Actinomycetota bacterium]
MRSTNLPSSPRWFVRTALSRVVYDQTPIEFVEGDTLAVAALRNGRHPARGGTLCLAGDCGNCVAIVDGVPWVRTCQTAARPGTVVRRHPSAGHPSPGGPESHAHVAVRHRRADHVVIGNGVGGAAAAAQERAAGPDVLVLDAGDGNEVIGIFDGPTVVVRTADGIDQLHAHHITLATGAAEIHPVCPGNMLAGIYTPKAATALRNAGVDLGRVVTVGAELALLVATADGDRVAAVELADGTRRDCDSVIVELGSSPRDVLARMAPMVPVSVVGSASTPHALPAAPTVGIVCPCGKITVEDLDRVWQKGFCELELVKRASLTGVGTCQGGVCMPHLRAFVADRAGTEPQPFTARPAARQLTLGEAAAGYHIDTFRRTPLHAEHVALGATLDRFGGWFRPWHYGDPVAEYWAVREAVSLGDVSTLGKMIVSGPDVIEMLERLYPNNVHDIKVGRARYVINLNERGHILDDGMILRDDDNRFTLTFTSGGASTAEMWVRDWIETWGLRVHVLDRTVSHAAINVTGPLAAELLGRAGVADGERPGFLQHRRLTVAGVPCHVMRLSFTGEASFELHHQIDRSVELWQALMHLGAPLGIKPHGLQALFGLRCEKGHIIVGQDTELDSSPRRVNMDWAVKFDKPAFIGRDALLRTAPLPDRRRLFGFTMPGPAPLEGSVIRVGGEVVGHVTSSWDSPLLGHAVLLGWQKRVPHVDVVEIDGREARVSRVPFYDAQGQRARA